MSVIQKESVDIELTDGFYNRIESITKEFYFVLDIICHSPGKNIHFIAKDKDAIKELRDTLIDITDRIYEEEGE